MTGGIWERAAADYEQAGVEFFGPLGRELVDRASLRPGDRVLDVGCGRGHVLFPALGAVGLAGRVTGVDLAEAMVALTAAELRKRDIRNATVQVGDAGAPEFPPGSFDAVLGGFMMFLLPDPAGAIRAYRSLLTSGGRLAFSTYGREDERLGQARAVLRRWAGLSADASPASLFDDATAIHQILESAGFRDVKVDDVIVETQFESTDQWWNWAWSVGLRGALEKIPADHLADAQAEAEAHLRRGPDGQVVLTTEIRFSTTHL